MFPTGGAGNNAGLWWRPQRAGEQLGRSPGQCWRPCIDLRSKVRPGQSSRRSCSLASHHPTRWLGRRSESSFPKASVSPRAPETPAGVRWKETGQQWLPARRRRGLTEARPGRTGSRRPGPRAPSSAQPARRPWPRLDTVSASLSRATGEEAVCPRLLYWADPPPRARRPPLSTPPPLLPASAACLGCPAASALSVSSYSWAPGPP